MSRLPQPGGDDGVWGDILNDFLMVTHNADGTIKSLSQAQITNLVSDLAAKATDSTVMHLSGNETASGTKTFSGNLAFPEQAARTGQIVMNSVNDPGGFVQKNIVFQDEGTLSRGGPVWIDVNGRVQAWLGWHDLIPSGSSHHGLEVKTAADPTGPNSSVLVTRFRLKSDADQTQAAFYSCSMLYIENGINSPNTQFGITFNTPTSGSVAAGTSSGTNYTVGKLTYNVDAGGVATLDIGVGLDNTTGAAVRVFRDTNTSTATWALYAADGTATQVIFMDAKTGNITMAGRLQFKTAADPTGPNSSVLVTRFRLKSDADQPQAAFYSCSMLYIENGINSPNTQFGITFNTPTSGSVAAGTSSGTNYTVGKLTY
ncbi:MAG TPA: hypothetical protein VLF67_00995, partial [Candidatus Saccharimonas sp.]|nr:hypothetical protein [Candidatus Saccharimonas sp.]